MELSVIVPVYNTEQDKLLRCFDSINGIAGYSVDFECLIIDDGSNAETAEACKAFASGNQRFRYICKENGGVSSARNAGIAHAQGEYICFVDSDDVVEITGAGARMFELMDGSYDLIFTDLALEDGEKKEIWKVFDLPEGKVAAEDVAARVTRDGKINGPVCKIIRRKFIQDHHIRFEENMISGEDLMFLMNMALCSPAMYYLPVVSYKYYRESITSYSRLFRNTDLIINNNVEIYQAMIRMIETVCTPDAISAYSGRATDRCMKQLFNIAADLAHYGKLDQRNKALLVQALQDSGIDQWVGKKISVKSKALYKVLKSRVWPLIYLYSNTRSLYLRIQGVS